MKVKQELLKLNAHHALESQNGKTENGTGVLTFHVYT